MESESRDAIRGNHKEGRMVLGSLASGVMMGLVGAVMTWFGGHPLIAVLLAYSIIGSLGTLFVAAMTMGGPARMGRLSR